MHAHESSSPAITVVSVFLITFHVSPIPAIVALLAFFLELALNLGGHLSFELRSARLLRGDYPKLVPAHPLSQSPT